MSRVPSLPRDQLSPEQQEVHDAWSKIAHLAFGDNGDMFIYETPEGGLMGPAPWMIHSPRAGKILVDLLYAMAAMPVSKPVRETAIMVCGAHFQTGYVLYSHISQALKAGLSTKQLDKLRKGSKPDDLDDECSITYDVVTHLLKKPGPLAQDLWDKSNQILGKDGTMGLLHITGSYAYHSIGMNMIDSPVPEAY